MGNNRIKAAGKVFGSCALILAEVLTSAGCKSSERRKIKKVSEDSVWYDSVTTQIEDNYKDKNIMYYNSNLLGSYKDGVVIKVDGSYELPEDFDWENGDADEYAFLNLDYYSFTGELINSVDVSKAVSAETGKCIENIFVSCGQVKLKVFDTKNGKDKCFLADVDLEKGVVSEFKELAYIIPEDYFLNNIVFCHENWIVGDYLVSCYNKGNSYAFIISDGDNSRFVDLSGDPKFSGVYIFSSMIVSDTEMLFYCLSNDVKFISLNLETGEAENRDEDCSWMNTIDYTTRILSVDGNNYISDINGIKYINFESKQLEELVSFNCCNLNRYTVRRMELLSVNEDSYIFGDIDWDDYGSYNVTALSLEKADKNPNAGKSIITAAMVRPLKLSFPICEAVRIFNENSTDHYLMFDNRYNFADYVDYSNAESEDDTRTIYYKGASALSNQLATDLLSGDGPDILLDAGDFSLIQSEEYLVDLCRYIKGKNGINESDYFSNVIKAAKSDDKLLYMPVSFSVLGITADRSDVRDGQVGFTFDEYTEYLHTVCNGKDPMNDTQLGVLSELYSFTADACVEGKTVNFNNISFRALCEYVKNNVIDSSVDTESGTGADEYRSFENFLDVNGYKASDLTLLGYPSIDGRGPEIAIETSIGISAAASSSIADGAWEFIRICLSDDIQNKAAMDGGHPVYISAFDSSSEKMLRDYNRENPLYKIDRKVIGSYKEMLMSSSVTDTADPAILCVITEEIQPYFLDQKSLDEVLALIQNRVTTIISERS